MSSTKENIYVFDPIRRKRILLTPEEIVRQELIAFLIADRGVPAGLISIEKGLTVNGLSKRCDMLVHDTSGQPLVLIECKAKSVNLTQQTFDQVARYNIALQVPWLIISNGVDLYCARVDFEKHDYAFFPDVPHYADF